ncbi:MAG: hypothetical protein JKY15_07480 [Deltaproteobacteria bacterium]|nr:hypothetical protein [Deltaproteobacteria bacterium]
MRLFFIFILVSNLVFAYNSLGDLRGAIDRLLAQEVVTLQEADALAQGAVDLFVSMVPPPTAGQLQRFRDRLGQVLARVAPAARNGRMVDDYVGWYEQAANLRISQLRPSMSMSRQRAPSVVMPVSDQDAWVQMCADYLPIQRNNGRTVASRATVLRTILHALAGDNQGRLGLLQGNVLNSQAQRVQVANTFLGIALNLINEAIGDSQSNTDAPRAFRSRMRALEIYAGRHNLQDILGVVREQRNRIQNSVEYQRLLGNAQQMMNQAYAARSMSRVPASAMGSVAAASSRAGAEERSDREVKQEADVQENSQSGQRRQRAENQAPGNGAPAELSARNSGISNRPSGNHQSTQRALLSTVLGVENSFQQLERQGAFNWDNGEMPLSWPLQPEDEQYPRTITFEDNRAPQIVDVWENQGAGDCLFYALGTTRQNYIQMLLLQGAVNPAINTAIQTVALNADYQAWARGLGRRLGTNDDAMLWNVMTGETVMMFQIDERTGIWVLRATYNQFTRPGAPVRMIGNNGGHWVELRLAGNQQAQAAGGGAFGGWGSFGGSQ